MTRLCTILFVSILLLAACGRQSPLPQALPSATPLKPTKAVTTAPQALDSAENDSTIGELATDTPAPDEFDDEGDDSDQNSVNSDIATPAVTTPTAAPLEPLTIEYLRQRDFEASDIKIEQTLAPGANYSRYIASYLSDGFKVYGLLTVPRGTKPKTGWPVIVFNHGYIPPIQYKTTERYVAYVDSIARSGYIVFKSDYRGHGESEGYARGGYGSPDYTIDVLNALASLKKYPDADPKRIGMWGHSMGGQVTLRSMVVSNDIKAGVIWGGVVGSYPELVNSWRRRPDGATPFPSFSPGYYFGWRGRLTYQYGTPEENPEFWASISPNSYVADLPGPVQLHHGTADEEVPLKFSQELYNEIKAFGKTVELYTYPGSNHNITQGFTLAMQRTIAFFDKYVKNARS